MASPDTAENLPVYTIPLHLLEAAPWNVTQPNKRSLNLLVENIKQVGFAETATVVPLESWIAESGGRVTEGRFRIISGHDKAQAALSAGLTEIPCSVLPEATTEELQKFLTVRMNTIKKKLDAQKFMKLFLELSKEQSEEIVKAQMMFTDESVLEQHIAQARKALPTKELREELDEKAPKLNTIDDLATVMQELSTRAGSTSLSKGFTIFTYEKQDHVYIEMDEALHAAVMRCVDKATTENRHITEVFKEALGVSHG